MTPGRTIAICLVASLATLAIAGASRHAGGTSPLPGAARHAGGSWPRSFFEGLFGMPPPRGAPRRPRPKVQRRSPRREPQRTWRRRRTTTPRSPSRPAERRRQGRTSDTATYRTMCVRLCDGYYWPISFATGRDSFGRDSKVCKRSCDSPAALYYYPQSGR